MPEKEMRRSHYLMSKITGRTGKDGFPIVSWEYHGSAYKFIGDMSPKKTLGNSNLEEIPENDHVWEHGEGVFPRMGEKSVL